MTKDALNIYNRKLLKKKHHRLGPQTPAPVIFFSPNITESGNCYYGTTPEFLLPEWEFAVPRPNHLLVPNPLTPPPSQGYYPPVKASMRFINEMDNNAQNARTVNVIRDPQYRYMNERPRPKGVYTMHGFREYKTVKQVDPDLEERFAYAKAFNY